MYMLGTPMWFPACHTAAIEKCGRPLALLYGIMHVCSSVSLQLVTWPGINSLKSIQGECWNVVCRDGCVQVCTHFLPLIYRKRRSRIEYMWGLGLTRRSLHDAPAPSP